MLRLVVGLGNPGTRYQRSRHNVGYRVIDALAERSLDSTRLFKPDSVFMNESGMPIRELARRNGIEPSELVIVCDDFSIPLGQLRIRLKGSSGGHNGLKSVFEQFGTMDVPRLRVGIGPVPAEMDPADFVLRSFEKAEDKQVEETITQAADAVEVMVKNGWEAAMNRFNQKKGDAA